MFASRRSRRAKNSSTDTIASQVESQVAPNVSYSLHELADALVKSTVDLAVQASRNLAIRTDAVAQLALDSSALARVAPELALSSTSAIRDLSNRANQVGELLLTVHQLTAQATDLLNALSQSSSSSHSYSLDDLIATFKNIAKRSVDAGETLTATIAQLDDGLDRAHEAIDPMLHLMEQVNAISIK